MITEEKKQKFWEWCGLKKIKLLWGYFDFETGNFCPHEGDRDEFDTDQLLCFENSNGEINWWEAMSDPTLDNIFRWAVPKLREELGEVKLFNLLSRWVERTVSYHLNPIEALFQAIMRVIRQQEKEVRQKREGLDENNRFQKC